MDIIFSKVDISTIELLSLIIFISAFNASGTTLVLLA